MVCDAAVVDVEAVAVRRGGDALSAGATDAGRREGKTRKARTAKL